MAQPRTRRKPPPAQTRRTSKKRQPLSETYWDITQRPLQCLIFLLPMILAYEAGMIALHGDLPEYQRPALAAKQLLQWFFSLFGASGYYFPGLAMIIVLLIWHIASKYPWKIAPQPLLGMAGESVLLAIPLLLLNQWLPSLQAVTTGPTVIDHTAELESLLLSVGAGLYEELVFRLIVITMIGILLVDILRIRQGTSLAIALVVSSLLFAAHHYHPIGADPWSSREFAFRAAAGGYLAAVFVLRGFGLAVGCHVIYDVMAFLS